MKLYLVIAHNVDGDNADLFVNADSRAEAVAHWRDYYVDEDVTEPETVFEVPLHLERVRGAIPWDLVVRA